MGRVISKILQITGIGLFVALIIFAIIVAFNAEKANRLYATMTLFDKDKIVYNFSHMDEVFLTKPIKRSGEVFTFGKAYKSLPKNFIYKEKPVTTKEFLNRRATTALLVIKDDKITFEKYYLGTAENDLRISWSMAKSFTATLFGIAVDEGLIDIDEPVSKYLPEMKGSGYANVPIRHVLAMSTGVKWNEDYADFNSDINQMGRILAVGGSLDEFTATLKQEKPSGQEFHYVSMDTHLLGMILRQVTGKSLVTLAEQHLWSKIGMEADAKWLTDSTGAEFALGGLNVRTRDYGRFGRLYLYQGNWNGEQIVPKDWVRLSTTPSADYNKSGPAKLGYGFQWWLPPEAGEGEFFAVGVYGQYIYVNQPEHLVIVKNSADLNFQDKIGSKQETIAFFRAIADKLHQDAGSTE